MQTLTASEARANLYRLIDGNCRIAINRLPSLANELTPFCYLLKIGRQFRKRFIC